MALHPLTLMLLFLASMSIDFFYERTVQVSHGFTFNTATTSIHHHRSRTNHHQYVPPRHFNWILNLSSEDGTDNDEGDDGIDAGAADDYFMTSLKNRITEMKDNEDVPKIPLVVLDCMVPRQVLRVRLNDPQVVKVVRHQILNETPIFGMRGTMKVGRNGDSVGEEVKEVKLKKGVEVEMLQKPQFTEEGSVLLVVKARRRFEVISEVENKEKGWTDATVKYLNSKKEEEEELSRNGSNDDNSDQMCIARAILKAAELTTLISEWIELARQYEKRPGQIDLLLRDIGNVPPSTEPSERAFWVGALINPLPEMGVATGIRPQLLNAHTAKERIDIACEGIKRSIAHMDKSDPLW